MEMSYQQLKEVLTTGIDKSVKDSYIAIIETYEKMGLTPEEALDQFKKELDDIFAKRS